MPYTNRNVLLIKTVSLIYFYVYQRYVLYWLSLPLNWEVDLGHQRVSSHETILIYFFPVSRATLLVIQRLRGSGMYEENFMFRMHRCKVCLPKQRCEAATHPATSPETTVFWLSSWQNIELFFVFLFRVLHPAGHPTTFILFTTIQ